LVASTSSTSPSAPASSYNASQPINHSQRPPPPGHGQKRPPTGPRSLLSGPRNAGLPPKSHFYPHAPPYSNPGASRPPPPPTAVDSHASAPNGRFASPTLNGKKPEMSSRAPASSVCLVLSTLNSPNC
jgi:hypothetical protein